MLWDGREHVFKKVVVRAPHSGGMQAESLAEVSVRPHSASFREEGLPTVATPVFSQGQSQTEIFLRRKLPCTSLASWRLK